MELVEQREVNHDVEAEYTLESPVKCSGCGEGLESLIVVRLLRIKVNFTSSLPRRGYAVACPSCKGLMSARVG